MASAISSTFMRGSIAPPGAWLSMEEDLGHGLTENGLFSRIPKFDHVRNPAVAGAHDHNRMRGKVEFVRLGLGYVFSQRRCHVMELDTGRHGYTDRFRRVGLRL